MSDRSQLLSREHPDGSVDAWLDGWHVRFPSDGGKPACVRSAPPNPPPADAAGEVRLEPLVDRQAVRSGRWIVLVSRERCEPLDMVPKPKVDGKVYRLSSMSYGRRGRDR